MVIAVFCKGSTTAKAAGLWQYDYGQTLRIQGLKLPAAAEVHFATQESGGGSVVRIGITDDGVTDVPIPDSMLDNDGAESDYTVYAFVYITDEASGQTEYKVKMPVKSRPKPEASTSTDEDLYAAAVALINAAADSASTSAALAKSYAVGDTGTRDGEDEDNAKYYSGLAHDALAALTGTIVTAKEEIDDYVDQKEAALKGDTGDVYFTGFRVIDGRLYMYTNSESVIEFYRVGSRLYSKIMI